MSCAGVSRSYVCGDDGLEKIEAKKILSAPTPFAPAR